MSRQASDAHLEIEIKLQLASFPDYLKLLGFVGAIEREAEQLNAFFDTPDRQLARLGWAFRVRATDHHGLMTLKGLPTAQGAAAIRPEIEEAIELQTALDIIHLRREALDFASAPVAWIKGNNVHGELVRLVMFKNTRLYKQVTLDDRPYQFEIDKTDYPDGSVEYELEVELPDRSAEHQTTASLRSLFDRLAIPFLLQGESKFARALQKAGLTLPQID